MASGKPLRPSTQAISFKASRTAFQYSDRIGRPHHGGAVQILVLYPEWEKLEVNKWYTAH
jgi:hypothetical protein